MPVTSLILININKKIVALTGTEMEIEMILHQKKACYHSLWVCVCAQLRYTVVRVGICCNDCVAGISQSTSLELYSSLPPQEAETPRSVLEEIGLT